MPISKQKAQSAIKTLASLDVGGVNRLLANAHLFDKHISRNALKEGSWFEKTSHTISDAVQANNLSEKRQSQFKAATGLDLDTIKAELAAGKGLKSFTLDGVTQDLTVRDVPDLLGKILKQPSKGMYDGGPGRFIYYVDLPAGYVARNINQKGEKQKLENSRVKLVISSGQGNVQIVTVFPVGSWYKEKAAALA